MSGWVPMPADGWPEMAELLTSTGRPWPASAVVTDLRWHVDQRVPLPGRPALCRRWAWNDRAVRAMLADEAGWRDPKHMEPMLRTGMVESRAGKKRTVPASPGQSRHGWTGTKHQRWTVPDSPRQSRTVPVHRACI